MSLLKVWGAQLMFFHAWLFSIHKLVYQRGGGGGGGGWKNENQTREQKLFFTLAND